MRMILGEFLTAMVAYDQRLVDAANEVGIVTASPETSLDPV